MFEVKYPGVHNKPCSCDYAFGDVGGQPVLVLKSHDKSSTPASSPVAEIVTILLAGDLFHTDARRLRVFVFYPTEPTGPSALWQEVTFKSIEQFVPPNRTIVQRALEWFWQPERRWVVQTEEFDIVPPALQKQLSALDPELR